MAYLTKHVPPAEMTEKEAKDLLKALGSDDARVWQPAYRDLSVRDVRLALTALDAWNENDTPAFRRRLGGLMAGHRVSPDRVKDDLVYSLTPPARPGLQAALLSQVPGKRTGVMIYLPDTYAEFESTMPNGFRKIRADVAAAALERIGTPAARKHLEALGGGHGASPFTVRAKRALEPVKLAGGNSPDGLADLWKQDIYLFGTPATVNRLLADPKDTVAFLKGKLKPLTLSKADGAKLLARLFGEDAKEMQAAMGELRYYDLRLATTAEDAWAEAKTPTHRGRLVSVLSFDPPAEEGFGRVDDNHKLLDYTFHRPDAEFDHWYAMPRVRDGLDAEDSKRAQGVGYRQWLANTVTELTASGFFHRWSREESAIHILDAIGTDDALALVKDMATGHPDAGPTKAAKAVLARRAKK